MIRTALGIAAQVVGVVAIPFLVLCASKAFGDALTATFAAHHLGF